MFHPATALHQPALRKTVEEDFAELPKILADLNRVEESQLLCRRTAAAEFILDHAVFISYWHAVFH